MRLEAQAKLGFYPIHHFAAYLIGKHLQLSPAPANPDRSGGDFQILDPCAGEGEAVKQIADALGLTAEQTYAVELDAGRAETCRENLGEGANVLGPCSFMGTRIRGQSFGLVYCNPPFDFELGGGSRQEETFARRCTSLLKPGSGILVMVMPVTAIDSNRTFKPFLDANYDDAAVYALPETTLEGDEEVVIRKYKEIVYIAKRRKTEVPTDNDGLMETTFRYRGYYEPKLVLPVLGSESRTWTVPRAWAPTTFDKICMTEEEMVEAVESSPLLKALEPPSTVEKRRPPLPLYKGHVALLLAAGMLDGVIYPEGEMPHVVRGTSKKIDFLAETTETTNADTGATTKKEVYSQKIVLTVRAVAANGQIKTFEDGEKDPAGIGLAEAKKIQAELKAQDDAAYQHYAATGVHPDTLNAEQAQRKRTGTYQ